MTRAVAAGWAVVVLALVAHNVFLWRGGLRLETDLLALLPGDEETTRQAALDALGDSTSRSVVVVVGAADEAVALESATTVEGALAGGRLALLVEPPFDPRGLFPFRDVLLSAADAVWLADAGVEDVASRAMALANQPVSVRLGRLEEDPLQLFASWALAHAAQSPVQPLGERLVARGEGKTWVVLRYELVGPAFALDGEPVLHNALERARRAVPRAEVLASGVPLFAESAAVQANHEVSTVGLGSLLAVVALVVAAFRSIRPLVLVVASVGVGVLAGVSVTALSFEKVHLLTLVFGASLVGVAEDYGIHYFASRQAEPQASPRDVLRGLRPGLVMALITSIAGYSMLAWVPFPGLRQVALFSVVGLAGAFVTVFAWFPALDGGEVPKTAVARAWAASRARWPRLQGRWGVGVVVLLAVAAAVGAWRARADDDVRALVPRDPGLAESHRRVEALLGLPSPAQLFLVRGQTGSEVLEREERLVEALEGLRARGTLAGVVATSTWVPSEGRQGTNRALTTRARGIALEAFGGLDGAPPAASPPLTVDAVLSTSLGRRIAPLWRPGLSVVLLRQPSAEALAACASLTLPGVTYIDRTAAMSAVLGEWRVRMTQWLGVGFLAVLVALSVRLGRRAPLALGPTALAAGLSVALVAQLGPVTLFHVLGVWILLGTGVDYAIFLIEHPVGVGDEAWFSVGLGAASTLLSFGLLGLSTTPAIAGFGLTVGVGTVLVWLVTPAIVDGLSR